MYYGSGTVAHSELTHSAGSRWMLRHMQQRRADVVAAVVKMWAMWRIKNLTPSYDVYLLEEQSIRFHPSCI